MTDQIKKIGLWTGTSLVVGNMVASGIFMLPATLASYGTLSLIGWLLSGLGAITLALVYSWLSRIMPLAQGGPYAYSRAGMGEFAGFWVAWSYWISVWCTNAALAIACVSYLTTFFPFIGYSPVNSVLSGLFLIWFLTWLNTTGIRNAGVMQLITTVAKIVPLALIAIGGLFYLNTAHFEVFNRTESSSLMAIVKATTLTFFAFLGLECATIPSTSMESPEKNIPKATIYGTLISTAIYILCTVAVMGILPPESLIVSKAPLADAAGSIWGDWARYLIGAGAVISTFGALNGWILVQGQIPAAAAVDKLLPAIFAKMNHKQTPVFGLVISSILVSFLMIMNYNKSLASAYEFAILLSTLAVLMPYLFSVVSYIILASHQTKYPLKPIHFLVAIVAFVFSVWAVVGSGADTVFWGFVLLLAGLPLYVLMKMNSASSIVQQNKSIQP
ncbi:MAG: amino acid permease [Saprospiraceae bacterium]|nr:amino acid permease [Saprospiraceae bacterium]